ncbi:MAG TPA: protein-glutamate O-methyltransferase CheR [Nitrospirae bacterium]|nr:protein-glutamate O-methyltransferase CheR [Nitrospirota bacterium]
MFEGEETIKLNEDAFRLLRELIRDFSGIYFDNKSRSLLERRLNGRLRSHNIKTFRDYYRYLLYDRNRDTELSEIMDILTVNETYFFREKNQLRAFSEEILPELKERNRRKRKIRILSAGCSSGEEPYTIAMLILESNLLWNWEIDIIGCDINRGVLQTARNAVYRQNSFRCTDEYYRKKYFVTDNGNSYRIKDNLKGLVHFGYLNLHDAGKVLFLGTMDVVFCRNVLIYFDGPSRKRVVESFYNLLPEDGYLLLGHAESLINISTAFSLKQLQHDLVYTKPVATEGEPHKLYGPPT